MVIRAAVLVAVLAAAVAGGTHAYDTIRAPADLVRTFGGGELELPGVVLVFQWEDCLGSGDFLQHWEELHRHHGISVLGRVLGDGTLSPDQQEIFTRYRLTFPVRGIPPRAAARAAGRLGIVATPFALAIDAEGAIVAAFPADAELPGEVVRRLTVGTAPGGTGERPL